MVPDGRRGAAADRLGAQVASMSKLRRRSWLTAVLQDMAEGTCSVLEHAYLSDVARAHGLPRGLRQLPERDVRERGVFRDVVYGGSRPRWRQYVELDSRLGHETTSDRGRDLERDLDAALERTHTVQLGYGQVLARPCATAARLGRLFQIQGRPGAATSCARCADAIREDRVPGVSAGGTPARDDQPRNRRAASTAQ